MKSSYSGNPISLLFNAVVQSQTSSVMGSPGMLL